MKTTLRATLAGLLLVLVIFVALPTSIMLVNGPRPDPLCGRGCYAPGVTENPGIMLPGQ